MKINLDAQIAAAEARIDPWDLKLAIEGIEYSVTSPSESDIEVFTRAGELGRQQQAFDRLCAMFSPAPPAAFTVSSQLASAAITCVFAYLKHRAQTKMGFIMLEAKKILDGQASE